MHYQDTFIGYSVSEITEVGATLGFVEKKIVPIAKDIDGNFLGLQVKENGSNTMVILDADSGDVDEQLN